MTYGLHNIDVLKRYGIYKRIGYDQHGNSWDISHYATSRKNPKRWRAIRRVDQAMSYGRTLVEISEKLEVADGVQLLQHREDVTEGK